MTSENRTADFSSLAWGKPYYTHAGEYWGASGIEQSHHDCLAAFTRLYRQQCYYLL